MISGSHRFRGHGSLRYVYNKGSVVRCQYFMVKFVPNEKRKAYRLAVVVSKKTDKSAVVRNRIRRRFYEAVRRLESRIAEPYDVVITPFSNLTADMATEELEKNIVDLFKKAKII